MENMKMENVDLYQNVKQERFIQKKQENAVKEVLLTVKQKKINS